MFLVNYIAAVLLVCAGVCVRRRLLKQLLLLGGSYVFYAAWGTTFLIILIASSCVNFALGLFLRRHPTARRLWIGVITNVALLAFFKYLAPLTPGLSMGFLHGIVMPVGMSFWTFQALSYLFDIYKEEEVDPTLIEFCLYMSFWPTVIMGPVCRLPKLLPQFREVHGFSSSNLLHGLGRIATGLAMKLLLAQFLGAALSRALETKAIGGGLDVWFIAIGFGFQIFFDFAGYSHIVIGAARVCGFTLEENFDSPYLSTTPSIFWTKWHMSLSSWIRDYVFVPMATVRGDSWWRYFALAFSMVLFGLWHGATIVFLLWGMYHGLVLVLQRIAQQYQRRLGLTMNGPLGNFFSWAMTFLTISLSWILFRASNLNEALVMLQAVFSPSSYPRLVLPSEYYRDVTAIVIGYFAYWGLTGEWIQETWEQFLFDRPGNPGLVRQFLRFSWENKLWWLSPMVATLALFAGLIVLFQSSRVTPFIYTLF